MQFLRVLEPEGAAAITALGFRTVWVSRPDAPWSTPPNLMEHSEVTAKPQSYPLPRHLTQHPTPAASHSLCVCVRIFNLSPWGYSPKSRLQ